MSVFLVFLPEFFQRSAASLLIPGWGLSVLAGFLPSVFREGPGPRSRREGSGREGGSALPFRWKAALPRDGGSRQTLEERGERKDRHPRSSGEPPRTCSPPRAEVASAGAEPL